MKAIFLLLMLSVKVQLPPDVHTAGCNVHQVMITVHGSTSYTVWEAEAFVLMDKEAFATDDHRWEIGRFPDTPKGRHQAWKVCDSFVADTEKIMKDVRAGR